MKVRQRKVQLQRRFRSVHGHWLCPCNCIAGRRGFIPGRPGFVEWPAARRRLPYCTAIILPSDLAPGGLVGKP